MDVDGSGAAVVVVAPDLLEQLAAAEDPARVLREELQQLELLVGEVEDLAADPGGVARLVDGHLAGGDRELLAVVGGLGATQGQADPGVDLGRAGGVEQDIVEAPVVRPARPPR